MEPPPIDADRPKVRESQLAKCEQLRKMFNDAGVNIHIHKVPFGSTDDDIDFNFQIAKALGCKAITTERNDQLAKRLAPFAEKHKIWVAFHNHTNNIPTITETGAIEGTVTTQFSYGSGANRVSGVLREVVVQPTGSNTLDFLCQVLEALAREGCTTVNLPDTVGYGTPD